MRVALRYLLRALLGLLALLVLILAGLTIYVRTASFNSLLEREVNSVISGKFRGQITVGAIQASRIGRVDLHDLVIAWQSRELVHVPAIEIGYALLPLLWHQVDLTITIDRPQVRVARDASGAWDLAEALQSTTPSSSEPSAYTVTLSALMLNGGAIDLAPNGLGGPLYHLTAANLDAQVELLRSGLKLTARKFSAHLVAPNYPSADVTLAALYDASVSPATVELTSFLLATQASSLTATATLRDPQAPTIDAHITLIKLAASDMTWLHAYPLRDDVAGTISLDGPARALHTVLALTAGPARANLVADADLTHPQQASYNGKLTLTHLDLGRLVLALKLAGQLDTSAQVKGQGTQLASVTAAVKANGHGLVINNIRTGNATLTADATNGHAKLAATVANGPSTIIANAALTNFTAPNLQAQIVTRHLNLQTLTISRSQPPSDLNVTLKLDAPRIIYTKLDLAHLDAHALVTLARSSLQNVALSNGSVDARLHGGIVTLAQMNLTAAGADLCRARFYRPRAPSRHSRRLHSACSTPRAAVANGPAQRRRLARPHRYRERHTFQSRRSLIPHSR